MPAKNLHRIDEEKTYSHIYNIGVERRVIFVESQDYEVFLGFLKDYLSPLRDPESAKKDFTVNGRVYRGTPHQPKNYFGKVELVAYSLMPSHFHLLLHQVTQGSIEGLVRSLCTRYSMYFNKKYKRTGSLFEGPYKSIHIKDEPSLLLLTHYLHQTEDHSSYPEYLGKRETLWVKPEVVQSYFNNVKGGFGREAHSYKGFVEQYKLNQKENESLGKIAFEDGNEHLEHLERREPEKKTEHSQDIDYKAPEFLTAALSVFLILTLFGLRNVMASTPSAIIKPSLTPMTLGAATEVFNLKKMVTVKAENRVTVNVRQGPRTDSQKIATAHDGDVFEFVSQDSEWCGIKLTNGTVGFISAKYIAEAEGGSN